MEMQVFLLRMLKKQRLGSILENWTTRSRDLFCTEAVYVKDGKYFRVRSFHTHMWMSPYPTGPVTEGDYLCMERLEDIASITEFSSYREASRFPRMTNDRLAAVHSLFDEKALEVVSKLLRSTTLQICSVAFNFSPTPVIITSVMENSEFLGSLAVTLVGGITILTATSPRLQEVISELRGEQRLLQEAFENVCE